MAHNLIPGFYLVDPSTTEVLTGPFIHGKDVKPLNELPYAVLEIREGIVPWAAGLKPKTGIDAPSYKDRACSPVRKGGDLPIRSGAPSFFTPETIPDFEPADGDVEQ